MIEVQQTLSGIDRDQENFPSLTEFRLRKYFFYISIDFPGLRNLSTLDRFPSCTAFALNRIYCIIIDLINIYKVMS